jgi:hypothetical protein
MYHRLPTGADFWQFLLSVDKGLADAARQERCACGGCLHAAHYRRKPRGPQNLPLECCYRLSFCCDRDGCRKRLTPPSVRFLGPKVYLAAVVVLVAAMRHGPTPRRVRELSAHFGADRRTIERWQTFWKEQFSQSPFWKVARGRLVPVIDVASVPLALVNAFLDTGDLYCGWKKLLEFLAPITVTGGLQSEVF